MKTAFESWSQSSRFISPTRLPQKLSLTRLSLNIISSHLVYPALPDWFLLLSQTGLSQNIISSRHVSTTLADWSIIEHYILTSGFFYPPRLIYHWTSYPPNWIFLPSQIDISRTSYPPIWTLPYSQIDISLNTISTHLVSPSRKNQICGFQYTRS